MVVGEVLSSWSNKLGSTERNIHQGNVHILGDMPLYLIPRGGAMLDCPTRDGAHLANGLPFNSLRKPRDRTRHIAKPLRRNDSEQKKRARPMSKRAVNRDDFHVFLGGSCNPTTWRKDEAIPLLEERGIKYFNPQVAEWTEDLVTVEHNAKESATVLFYVLDRRTRNVVGIVEVANFAGSQRDMVLVTYPYRKGELVAGENIGLGEYEELCSALVTLEDLVARQGIVVHRNIKDAITKTSEILNTSSSQRKTPLRHSHSLGSEESTRKPKSGKGELNLTNVCIYLSSNKKITDLKGISSKAEPGEVIKRNQLCSKHNDKQSLNGSSDMYGFLTRKVPSQYDIYVGGSCFDYEWKDQIALPLLRESGLNFTFADCKLVNSSRASISEASAMENSKVLLFVITNKTRGLETMALASYFIGCRKNVVLCIQNLPENAVVGTEVLSAVAIKDYNRGRTYLSDLAVRSGVPVFDNVAEAIQAAISRCRTSLPSVR